MDIYLYYEHRFLPTEACTRSCSPYSLIIDSRSILRKHISYLVILAVALFFIQIKLMSSIFNKKSNQLNFFRYLFKFDLDMGEILEVKKKPSEVEEWRVRFYFKEMDIYKIEEISILLPSKYISSAVRYMSQNLEKYTNIDDITQ